MPSTAMQVVPAFDSYWRINNYKTATNRELKEALSKSGYNPLLAGLSKSELILMKQRMDRGLLIYESCSRSEIQTFLEDRMLTVRPFVCETKLLKEADDDLRFHRFLDLPPEIRLRIYEYYVSAFPEALKCPTQPPLARSHPLIRKEMLPVFFKLQTFVISYYPDPSSWLGKHQLTKETAEFLHKRVAKGCEKYFRHARLEVRKDQYRDSCSRNFLCKIDIDIRGTCGTLLHNPNAASSLWVGKEAKIESAILTAILTSTRCTKTSQNKLMDLLTFLIPISLRDAIHPFEPWG